MELELSRGTGANQREGTDEETSTDNLDGCNPDHRGLRTATGAERGDEHREVYDHGYDVALPLGLRCWLLLRIPLLPHSERSNQAHSQTIEST